MDRMRRMLTAGLASIPALSLLGRNAQAAEPLKISHQFPSGSATTGDFRDQLCRRFAAGVEKKTNGALTAQVFPGSSLMKVNSQFSALRKGALDLSLVPISYSGGELAEVNIGLMPDGGSTAFVPPAVGKARASASRPGWTTWSENQRLLVNSGVRGTWLRSRGASPIDIDAALRNSVGDSRHIYFQEPSGWSYWGAEYWPGMMQGNDIGDPNRFYCPKWKPGGSGNSDLDAGGQLAVQSNAPMFMCEMWVDNSNVATVEATVDGDSLGIAFNARYVADVLNLIDSPEVELILNGPLSPGLIRAPGDDSYRYVIMPVRVAI